jgi:hypothetical protein
MARLQAALHHQLHPPPPLPSLLSKFSFPPRALIPARRSQLVPVCFLSAQGGTQSAQGCRPPRYPRRGLTFICSLPGHKSHRPRDSSQACAWPAFPSLLCYSHSIRYLYRIETDACQWAEQDILLLLPSPCRKRQAIASRRVDEKRRLSLPVDSGTCMVPVL